MKGVSMKLMARLLFFTLLSCPLFGAGNSLVQDFGTLVTSGKNAKEVFKQELSRNKFVLVKCTLEYCGPCKKVAPKVAELANVYKGRVQFLEVNISDFEEVVRPYNIRSAPSFIIFANGSHVTTITGSNNVDKIAKELDTQLNLAQAA